MRKFFLTLAALTFSWPLFADGGIVIRRSFAVASAGGGSSPAFVQSTQTFNGGSASTIATATFTATTASGSTLFVGIRTQGSGQFNNCLDAKSNVYTYYGGWGDGSSQFQLWIASNALSGVTWIKCNSPTSANYGINIVEASGITGSTGTFQVSSVTVTTNLHMTTSTGSLSGLTHFIYCGMAASSGNNLTATAGNGYTLLTQYGNGATTGQFFTEYQVTSTDRPCDLTLVGSLIDGRAKEIAGQARK